MQNGRHVDLTLDKPLVLSVTALPAIFDIIEEQPVTVNDPSTGEEAAFTLTRKMTADIVAGENGWDNGWNVCDLPSRKA